MLTIGHPFELLSEVDSTNNYIADHPRLADMSEGTAILTYHQTNGRGQRQRNWQSVKDKDLAVSYLLRPQISPDTAFVFNKLVALSLRECISEFVTGSTKIKWPNDILLGGKKVAGILVEPAWYGITCRHMIVGIGINVNSNIDRSQWNATSFAQAEGKQYALFEVFERLNHFFKKYYQQLLAGDEESISSAFDEQLFGLGEEVEMNLEGRKAAVKILGVDSDGRLRIEGEDGIQSYQHGAIQINYSRIISK